MYKDNKITISAEEIELRLDAIREYMESNFSIGSGGVEFDLEYVGWKELFVDFADFVQLEYFIGDVGGIPDEVEFFYSVLFEVDRTHRNFLIIEHNWKTGTFNNEAAISLIFTPMNQSYWWPSGRHIVPLPLTPGVF